MAYQALYRKWRPMTFDEVVGQEHITQTLKNEIISSQLAHAYLFCGTRGTGKTSTAKILARAVNCENPKDGNPCNECDVCRGILDDSITDVYELDGASRNKVENIRDIIEDVVFLPSRCKKKVYIIDEVHMVTTAAFNALLKTLEEPPEHVMFILATTELNKVPATVLSRCQRFDFRRITADVIKKQLKLVTESMQRSATDDALSLIAELSGGSMRDSMSILDQCLGYGSECLTYDEVLDIVGITDYEAMYSVCASVAENDAKDALLTLDEVISCGKEIDVFIDSLVKFTRDLTVIKVMDNPEKILTASSGNIERMKALAGNITQAKLLNCLKLLNECTAQLKMFSFKRTIAELTLIKMCNPMADSSPEALADRIAALEKQLQEGNIQIKSNNTEAPKEKKQKQIKSEEKPKEEKKETGNLQGKDGGSEITNQNEITDKWEEIKAYIKSHGGMPLLPHLSRAKPVMIKERLAIVFGSDAYMSKTVVSKQTYIELIKTAIEAVTGKTAEVGCFTEKEVPQASQTGKNDDFSKIEELAKKHDIVEIIE